MLKPSEYLKAKLEPDGDGAILRFTCPHCNRESYIHLSKNQCSGIYWLWIKGEAVDDLTISPSVRLFNHIHFNITEGEVIDHNDEPHEAKARSRTFD